MGQNSSTQGGGVGSPRKQKPPRPSDPPKIPKIPNYVIPENKVIPNGIGDMENARKLLRPVSQELTKFHPDFADIFQYDQAELDFLKSLGENSSLEDSLNEHTENKENDNSINSNNTTPFTGKEVNLNPDPLNKTNGVSMHEENNVTQNNQNALSKSMSSGELLSQKRIKETNLKRSHSIERERLSQPKIVGIHKRQASLTVNNVAAQQPPVILEDPREHLYNITRHEPFSNLMPANASLPLKNSFDSDYSLNLTYAQLAEYRRQQRNTSSDDIKKEQRLKELGQEIKATNTVPKSPFQRENLGSKPATPSISTSSSTETGVSKSKKKRAPPPPPPPTTAEPPVDYDMQDVSTAQPGTSLKRSNSSNSNNLRNHAPQPLTKRLSVPVIQMSRVESNNAIASKSNGTEVSSSQVEQSLAPPPPLLPPIPPPTLPKTKSPYKQEQKSSVIDKEISTEGTSTGVPAHMGLKESLTNARAQLQMLKEMGAKLKATNNESVQNNLPNELKIDVEVLKADETDIGVIKDTAPDTTVKDLVRNDPSVDVTKTSETKETFDIPIETNAAEKDKQNESPKNQVKRMNSLLQHDIILAAQAQATKQRKSKPPLTLDKPKDPAEVFREELRKAAQDREERLKDKFHVTQNNIEIKKSDPSIIALKEGNEGNSITGLLDFHNLPKTADENNSLLSSIGTADGLPGIPNGNANRSFEEMSISSNSSSQRVFTSAWTPEDDLDPDDDMKEIERIDERRLSSESHGFRRSLIPMKVQDLKDNRVKNGTKIDDNNDSNKVKNQKEKKKSEKIVVKNKQGGISRFKKSVQDNVKNAFGSISKASGKLLKKNKSEDFLNMSVDSYPRPRPNSLAYHAPNLDDSGNWALVHEEGENPMRRTKSEDNMPLAFVNGTDNSMEYSDNSDDDIGDIDFAAGIDGNNHSDVKDTPSVRQMKRAGVAYVSGKGQIIVLPEYNTVTVDAEGNEIRKNKLNEEDTSRAPKLYRKKDKKLTYESTVRIQERTRKEEIIAKEIREKENQIERERLRQQEIERGFRRLRDLDAEERLQRMQTENILQQLTYLQQQQVQQAHANLTSSPSIPNSISSIPTTSFVNGAPSAPSFVSNQNDTFVTISNIPQTSLSTNNYPQHMPATIVTPVQQPHLRNPHSNHSNIPNGFPSTNNNYTAHTTPIVGNIPTSNNITNSNNFNNYFPNFSTQDLNQLSDYMRMMGVAPPATQQQWAFLLSSVRINAPETPGAHLSNNVYLQQPNTMNGPDLSRVFGMGKSVQTPSVNAIKQPTYIDIIHNHSSPKVNAINNSNGFAMSTSRLIEVEPNVGGTSHNNLSSNLALTNGSLSESHDFKNSNGIVQNGDGALGGTNQQTRESYSEKSPHLTPKVYGPLGFKPVPFKSTVS